MAYPYSGAGTEPGDDAAKAILLFGGIALGLLALKALLEDDDDD